MMKGELESYGTERGTPSTLSGGGWDGFWKMMTSQLQGDQRDRKRVPGKGEACAKHGTQHVLVLIFCYR